jgi:hypothetical protein
MKRFSREYVNNMGRDISLIDKIKLLLNVAFNQPLVYFFRKNINCSIEESLKRFEEVMAAAKIAKIPARG